MQTADLKTAIHIMRQVWGKAKNQAAFMQSATNLLEDGENGKALSLLKAIREAQESQNELLMAQVIELEQRIFDINSNVKKPKYTAQDWKEWEQYQYGEIVPDGQPPMIAPPLDDEFYSEPNQQEETFTMGENPFNK